MKGRIKFSYGGSWTNWFDVDDIINDPVKLDGLKIDSVVVEEECTKEQAQELIREFHDMNFKF